MSVRVFCRVGAAAPGERVTLDEEESRYLVRVRRRKLGDAVELLDGEGGKWSAVRDPDTDPRRACVRVLAAMPPAAPTRRILLVQALVDAGPLATTITAATELGASDIALVATQHGQGHAPGRDRIDRLVRAAMRQSGRPTPPRVHLPNALAEALEVQAEWPGYFAWERLPTEPHALRLAAASGYRVVVGPEGGFHPDEVALLHARGLVPLSLGPWTLRSETAATAAITRLLWAPLGTEGTSPPPSAPLATP